MTHVERFRAVMNFQPVDRLLRWPGTLSPRKASKPSFCRSRFHVEARTGIGYVTILTRSREVNRQLMPIFDQLSRAAAERGVKFIVIGGHAVVAHGYARQTMDLDLLARKADREQWKALLGDLGYKVFHEQEVFSQFAPGDTRTRALDMMWVNDSSFAGMMAEAVERDFGGVRLWIPSLEHLLALKLHAAKYGSAHRRFRDLMDIVYLAEANRLDIRGEKFKRLCEKYGDLKVYESILVIAEGR